MRIPQGAKDQVKETQERNASYIPSINIIYTLTLGKMKKAAETAEEKARISGYDAGMIMYNRETVLEAGDLIAPIAIRGCIQSFSVVGGQKKMENTFYNPTETADGEQLPHSGLALTEWMVKQKNAGYTVDEGMDVLVYIKKVDKFGVIRFKANTLDDFDTVMSLGESGNYITIDSEDQELKNGNEWFRYKFGASSEPYVANQEAEDTAYKVYQKLN